ncbi:uncharacterized protein LOC119687752 [Teleopsis dalmanni]|uniref:uncharacterized protein LOC119687752 n=1 Tax=Teleopsis dalmanni TaxID=139649 RepID=UPI0018CE648E|nr:uncharacterized protein LOC119687752 [Teleopsis dalmanni]XP_037958128.1 uncharacterized protein LOC119687752 [Teleopsis dalmanni]
MYTFQIQLKDADTNKSDTNIVGTKTKSPQKSQYEHVIKEENNSSSSMIHKKPPRRLIPWPNKVKDILRNKGQSESEAQETSIGNQQSLSSSYDYSSLITSDSKPEAQRETTNVGQDGFVPAQKCDIISDENRILMKQGCVEQKQACDLFQPQPIAIGTPSELQMDSGVVTNERKGQKVVQQHREDLHVDKCETLRICISPSGSLDNNKNINSDIVEKVGHMINNLKEHLEQLELNVQSINANLKTFCEVLSKYAANITTRTNQNPEVNIFIFKMLNAFEKLYQELQLENCSADHKNKEIVQQRVSLLKSIKTVIKDLRGVGNNQNSGYLSKSPCSSDEAIEIIHKDDIGRVCNEVNANDFKGISNVQNSNVLKAEKYSLQKQCNTQNPSQLQLGERVKNFEVDIMKPSTSKKKGGDQITIGRKGEYNEKEVNNSKILEHFQSSDVTLCQNNVVKSNPENCTDLPLTSKHNISPKAPVLDLPSEKRVTKFELLKKFLKNSDERNSIETECSEEEKPQCSKDSSITYTYMSSDSPKICDCCSRSYDPVYDSDVMRVISDATMDLDRSDIQIRLNISMNDVIYVKIILMTSLQEIKCFYVTVNALESAELAGLFEEFCVYLV